MKILIVQTGFLGDVVLSTPVPTNIKRLYPGSSLSILVTPAAATLVQNHPAVDEVIIFDKRQSDSGLRGLLRMANLIKAKQFDIVFSLHKSWRTGLLLYLSGIRERYGFSEAKLSWLYTKTAPRSDLNHDVLRNLAILRTIGKDPRELDQTMVVGIDEESRLKVEQFLSGVDDFVAIAPGSVWLTKRWTEEGFTELIRKLIARKTAVAIIGGRDDGAMISRLGELSADPLLLDATGKLSLTESAEVIRRAKALITNDSAPLHLGSAMKTPTVAIFCATVPEFGFGPWQNIAEIVDVPGLDCRPCRRHGGNSCPTGTHACRVGVTAEMVLQALNRVIQRSNDRSSAA